MFMSILMCNALFGGFPKPKRELSVRIYNSLELNPNASGFDVEMTYIHIIDIIEKFVDRLSPESLQVVNSLIDQIHLGPNRDNIMPNKNNIVCILESIEDEIICGSAATHYTRDRASAVSRPEIINAIAAIRHSKIIRALAVALGCDPARALAAIHHPERALAATCYPKRMPITCYPVAATCHAEIISEAAIKCYNEIISASAAIYYPKQIKRHIECEFMDTICNVSFADFHRPSDEYRVSKCFMRYWN